MIERYLPLQPGLSCAGDGFPVTGRIRNLHAVASMRLSAQFSWATEHADDARVFIYVDGQLRADVAASDLVTDINYLGEGDSSAQFVVGGAISRGGAISTDPTGQNALLIWTPSQDSDVAGYRIYDGDSEPVAELTDMTIQERVRVAPDAGTGAGRISVWGAVPPGERVNGAGQIEVTGDRAAKWSFAGGAAVPFEFVPGTPVTLPMGVNVTFHDASYDVGDVWDVLVGPPTIFVSEALVPGEYGYSIAAFDVAGNESAQIAAPSVYIAEVPDPVENVAMELVSGDLEISFTVPAGADGVRLYSNFNPITGVFEDYIETDGLPMTATAASPIVFPDPGVEGRLLFYLRTFNVATEREDAVVYSFGFPPEPGDVGVVLREPTNVVAIPDVGGTWRLEWDFRVFPEHDVTQFNVYKHAPDGAIDYDNDLLDTVDFTAGAGDAVKRFVFAPEIVEADPIRLAVRAGNGFLETLNVDYVVLVPDATAPVFAGPAHGGPA